MGTHPIFESDFDCLTDLKWGGMSEAALPPKSEEPSFELTDDLPLLRRRIAHAQRNIAYLQEQHKATLSSLHSEIDRLKLQNKDQQWRLIMSGTASSFEIGRQNQYQQTEAITPEVNFREKILEEENLDLKSRVLSLIKSNDRLKQELVIRSKSEKMYETKKYHDVKYKSKFQKSSSPTKILPLIPGCKINGHDVNLDFPSAKSPVNLPTLKGINHHVKHNRRLDAIHRRAYFKSQL